MSQTNSASHMTTLQSNPNAHPLALCKAAIVLSIECFEGDGKEATGDSKGGIKALEYAIDTASAAQFPVDPAEVSAWVDLASIFLHTTLDTMGACTHEKRVIDDASLILWHQAVDAQARCNEHTTSLIEQLELAILNGPLKDEKIDRALKRDWIGAAMQTQRLDLLGRLSDDHLLAREAMRYAAPIQVHYNPLYDSHMRDGNLDTSNPDDDDYGLFLLAEWIDNTNIAPETIFAIAQATKLDGRQSAFLSHSNWMSFVDDKRFDALASKWDTLNASLPFEKRIQSFSSLGPGNLHWHGDCGTKSYWRNDPSDPIQTRALAYARGKWKGWSNEEKTIGLDQWVIQALLGRSPEDCTGDLIQGDPDKKMMRILEWANGFDYHYGADFIEKLKSGQVKAPSLYGAGDDQTNGSYLSMACSTRLIVNLGQMSGTPVLPGHYARDERLTPMENTWQFLFLLGHAPGESYCGDHYRLGADRREDGEMLGRTVKQMLIWRNEIENPERFNKPDFRGRIAARSLLHAYRKQGQMLSKEAWEGFAPFAQEIYSLFLQTHSLCWQYIFDDLETPLPGPDEFLRAQSEAQALIMGQGFPQKDYALQHKILRRLSDLFKLHETLGPNDTAAWAQVYWKEQVKTFPDLTSLYESARISAQTAQATVHEGPVQRL